MEKNLKKNLCMYVYIHIYKLNHFAVPLKLTQHCELIIIQHKTETAVGTESV